MSHYVNSPLTAPPPSTSPTSAAKALSSQQVLCPHTTAHTPLLSTHPRCKRYRPRLRLRPSPLSHPPNPPALEKKAFARGFVLPHFISNCTLIWTKISCRASPLPIHYINLTTRLYRWKEMPKILKTRIRASPENKETLQVINYILTGESPLDSAPEPLDRQSEWYA